MQHSQYEKMSELELVVASQKHDAQAFNHLMKKYASFIKGQIAHRTDNKSDADDLSQEVCINTWNKLSNLRNSAHFRSWLCRIIANMVNDYFRKVRRERSRFSYSLDDEMESNEGNKEDRHSRLPAPSKWSAEASLDSREACDNLAHLLSHINPIYRIPLVRAACGESYDSISSSLGIGMGTIKSRIARGRAQAKALKTAC